MCKSVDEVGGVDSEAMTRGALSKQRTDDAHKFWGFLSGPLTPGPHGTPGLGAPGAPEPQGLRYWGNLRKE